MIILKPVFCNVLIKENYLWLKITTHYAHSLNV